MPEIEALGAGALVVSFTPPNRVKAYVEKYPQPFPVASDPDMRAYQAFALGRVGYGSFFRPATVWRFLKLICHGWLPGKLTKGDDLLQLGGDFILDKEQRLAFAHPSGKGLDRPKASAIVLQLKSLR